MTDKTSTDSILRTWNPQALSANKELLGEIRSLYAKSRDLQNSNGLANSIVDTVVDKAVGQGLKVIPQIDYKVLGITPEKAKEWNDKVESLWNLYSNSKDFDSTGKNDFAESSRLALRTVLMNGEVLALPHWKDDKFSMFNTQIQLVECDRLITPPNKENDDNIKGGIEFDTNNRPIAYYLAKEYPDDDIFNCQLNIQRIPITTEFGRKRVIHVFKQDRVEQARGKPIFAPILTQFKKLDLYEEAELSAAVVSAMIALIIESEEKEDDELMKMFGTDKTEVLGQVRKGWNRGMRPGNVMQLFPGEKAHTFTPNRPNSAFSAFVENITRSVGIGSAGLPYEMVMKDFSKCNYSSARAALQEGWERLLTIRKWFVTEWVKENYSLFIEEIANKGLIDAPDFYKYKEAYLKFACHGPTRGILDPVKEAKAAEVRLSLGISTLQEECAANGANWEDVLEQRAREEDKKQELKLNLNPISLSYEEVEKVEVEDNETKKETEEDE